MQYISRLRVVPAAHGAELPLSAVTMWGYPSVSPFVPALPPTERGGHACANQEPWGDGLVAGGLSVTNGGKEATWYASRIPGMGDGALAASGDWMALLLSNTNSPRTYLSSDCSRPYEYQQHRLLGGSISFNLDLSAVRCASEVQSVCAVRLCEWGLIMASVAAVGRSAAGRKCGYTEARKNEWRPSQGVG